MTNKLYAMIGEVPDEELAVDVLMLFAQKQEDAWRYEKNSHEDDPPVKREAEQKEQYWRGVYEGAYAMYHKRGET